MSERRHLVPTGELAAALHLSPRTIQNYRRQGLIEPDSVSAGGHAKWDVDRVRARIQELAAARGESKLNPDETED